MASSLTDAGRGGRAEKKDLACFCLLLAALILGILWWPLYNRGIAYNLNAALSFQPWASYPEFPRKAAELLSPPFFGRMACPWDAESQFYPWLRFAAEQLGRGRLPAWFPAAQGGTPFIAKQQSGVFNPYHVLFYLFQDDGLFNLIAFLKLFVSGFFTFLFARLVGLRRAGSWLAGVLGVFPAGVYFWWSHPHSYALTFFPPLLWVTEKYAQDRSLRSLMRLTAVVAVSTLFGHAETSIHGFILAGLYLLLRLGHDPSLGPREKAKHAARFALAGALAALPAAVHLLPSWEYMGLSYTRAWRSQHGVSWDVLNNYTRPFCRADIPAFSVAVLLLAVAWRQARSVFRPRAALSARSQGARLALLTLCAAGGLALFLVLGMDEHFLSALAPESGFSQAVLPLTLALFALIDPKLPAALRALVIPWLLSFGVGFRMFGLVHLFGTLPFLGQIFHDRFHLYMPFLACAWAGWGLQRLIDASAWSVPERRRAALLFAGALAAALAAPALAFQLRPILERHIDVGLHPRALVDPDNPRRGGLMGAGRKKYAGAKLAVKGWVSTAIPVARVTVGNADDPSDQGTEADLLRRRDRTYFHGEIPSSAGAGRPAAVVETPSGRLRLLGSPVEPHPPRGLRRGAVLLAAAAGLILASCLLAPSSLAVSIAVFLLSLLELCNMSSRWVPASVKAYALPSNPVAEYLRSDQSLYRLNSLENESYWRPASSSLFGLQDWREDDAIDLMRVVHFNRLSADISSEDGRGRHWGLLDLANAKYYLAAPDRVFPASRFDLVFRTGTLNVFRSKHVLPRALVFQSAHYLPGEGLDDKVAGATVVAQAKAWLQGHYAHLRRTLLVHDRPPDPIPETPDLMAAEARILRYEPSHVEIEAETARPGYLFLGDAYYPGWRAWVDGREERIVPAWLCFRAVRLEPGRHRVVFRYRPSHWGLAVFLSAAGCLAWLLAFLKLSFRVPDRSVGDAVGGRVIEAFVLAPLIFWGGWAAGQFLAR